MKLVTKIILLFFIMISVCASAEEQDSIDTINQTESKVRFPVWYNPSDATDIYGMSLALELDLYRKQTINGISISTGDWYNPNALNSKIKSNGLNLAIGYSEIAYINGISISFFTKFKTSNGFNFSLTSECDEVNGVLLSFHTQCKKTNGLQIGLVNFNDFYGKYKPYYVNGIQACVFGPGPELHISKLNGVQIGLLNNIAFGKGVQIGSTNECEELFEGIQFGIFNSVRRKNNFIEEEKLENVLKDDVGIYGLQLGVSNSTIHLQGVQIGLFNNSSKLNGIQIGLINWTDENWMPIVNWNFD